MTACLYTAATGRTPEDRACLELKHLYLEELRRVMTAWASAVGPDDTVLNGGDVALAGSLGERGRARIRAAPGRKLLVVGNHDFGRRTGLLEPAGQGLATGIVTVDTDPPLVLTHVPIGVVPRGWVNLHGHVHNNEPLPRTPHINVCVEHTDYRPLLLESLATFAKLLLAGNVTGRRDHRRPDPERREGRSSRTDGATG